MKNFLTAVAAAALLSAVVPHVANAADADMKEAAHARLKAADTNADGMISKAEAEADAKLPRVAKKFDTLDEDKDGQLSAQEFKVAAEKRATRRP